MKNHTSFKVGGNAQILIVIKSLEDLREALKIIKKFNLKHCIIGNGSNVLFCDED
jgi:UDP-N-acetylmuramate dehydrogenase